MTDSSCTTEIRPLRAEDSIAGLTALLHRAYARLGAMGLNYTAVDQGEEVTRRRAGSGQCLVATIDGRLAGTIVFYDAAATGGSPWLDRPDVAMIGQFGVDPDVQGSGIGLRLITRCEEMARAGGAAEIALDTAETAHHLVNWYSKLGYRFIEHMQWDGKTYRSVIMSKPLGG